MTDYLTDPDNLTALYHLLGAMAAGGIIGLERSFHGRPAGFRTHTLVCLASALLMSLSLFQEQWLPQQDLDSIVLDPTRTAQGIMTGIGFLGAGVIFMEGLTVRGLTTAASIWVTAAIGILFGVGFYFPAVAGTLLTLFTLSLFRRIEQWLPTHSYALLQLSFEREKVCDEAYVRELLQRHNFAVSQVSYRINQDGRVFEYKMMVHTRDVTNSARLAVTLHRLPELREFKISPAGDWR